MAALLGMLGGGGAPAAEPEAEAGGFDLSALMGGGAVLVRCSSSPSSLLLLSLSSLALVQNFEPVAPAGFG